MEDQPTFEPKPNDIGEGPEGAPPVLPPTENPAEEAPRNTGTLPDAWDNGTVADVHQAEQGVLPGDEKVKIQPAGSVPTPELKPGQIGYSENTGEDPVITNQ